MRFHTLPLLLTVALWGCGSDKDSAGTDSPSTTATPGTPTGNGAGTGGATGTGTGTATGTTPTACAGGPLAAPIPNCAPPVLPSTGDFDQDCVDRINQFRWECQCLPPLDRWTDAEACTDQQAANDQAGGVAHANFGDCGENAQNTCPNWNSDAQIIEGCLQMMWDEGPGQPFADHGHYINMSSTQYSKVACGRSSNGGVWSNQNFRP